MGLSTTPLPDDTSNEQLLASGVSMMLTCLYCHKGFHGRANLHQHIIGVHGKPQFTCGCGKTFTWRKSFHRHTAKCPHNVDLSGELFTMPESSDASILEDLHQFQ